MEDPGFDVVVLRSLRRIIRAVDLYSSRLRSQHGITGTQLLCLVAVSGAGNATATELSREIQLSASTLVGVLDRLEAKNLIYRTRDAGDRRRVLISLTETGKSLVRNAPSPLQANLANGLKNLSKLEQEAIALSLEKVVGLMEAEELDAAPILDTGRLDQDEPSAKTPESA
jgi:DNA-binding MarR family transcriptional regulator